MSCVTINNVCGQTNDGEMVVVDDATYRIRQGEMYFSNAVFEDLADNAEAIILFRTPSGKEVHVRVDPMTAVASIFQLFDGPTVTSDGTTMFATNRNRNSTNTAGSAVFHTPTTSSSGTMVTSLRIPAGFGGFVRDPAKSGFFEWVLAPSTEYLFKLRNVSGSTADVGFAFDYFETTV